LIIPQIKIYLCAANEEQDEGEPMLPEIIEYATTEGIREGEFIWVATELEYIKIAL